MKIKGMFIGIAIVIIVLSIITSPPIFVFDLLLLFSIASSVVILLYSIYSKRLQSIMMFPTVLYVFTIFKLTLNIYLTYLILSYGYAGNVVNTFVKFIIGNNLAMSIAILVVLVILNVMLVVKSSKKAAKVADKSNFFAAMNDVAKLVKIDMFVWMFISTASIIAVIIMGKIELNITGMPPLIHEAAETYALTTVGIGVIGQILSILIAVTVSNLVTEQ